MTEEKGQCQQFSDPKSQPESFLSLFYQHKCLPVLSVVIILASVAIKYLTELKLIVGLSNSLPWGNPILLWCCFILYSFGLIWISLVLSQRLYGKTANPDSPNVITTLRSHLTFLPIIHFIRQRPCTFEFSAGITSNDQGDGSSLHSNGDDKEYLSKLEFQRDSLIDAILESCVFPWYERISDEKTFPQQSKQILQATFDRLAKKFRHMDRTGTTREAIEIIHFHWKSYCEAAKRAATTEESLERSFKYVHSCVGNKEELSKHYENILRLLLKDLVVPDLQSNLLCQFLAGILVKGFLFYYIEMISDPKWVNAALKKYISVGAVNSVPSILSTGSSQDSLTESMSPASKSDSMESPPSRLEFEELSSGEIIPIVCLADSLTTENLPHLSLSQDANEVLGSQSLDESSSPTGSSLGRVNGDDKNKKAATLSAALGGVLSTTALTLLPEGSSYSLKGLSGSGESSRASPSPSNSEQGQLTQGFSDKDNTQSGDNQTPSDSPPTPVESPSANKSVISISSRHFSLDSSKGKTTLAEEKTSKSLDETQANCNVIRQTEFAFSFDDTNKLQVDTSTKSDVSPTYDEPEDFAATIAKLRSLLEQRESQKNLVEGMNMHENEPEVFNNSPPEKHSPEKTTTQQSPQPIRSAVDNIRPSLNSQSSASSLGSDASFGSNNSHSSLDTEKLEKIVDELEDTGPTINRFFLNVAIPKTEACSDSSGNFILYCIQYEGVYVEENDDGQLEKLVLRTTTIKRRFQEFLMLQSHMEESSLWRPHIKGIKAPNKWLNLSFSKSESTNLAQRKINLEKYLQQLCYHPVLGFCPQLRQFMAYGEDGFQAFASSDAIPLHRFEKLAKKFTGVFNSLRDALPSFEPELLAISNPIDPVGKSPTDNKAKSLFSSFLRAEKLEKMKESAKATEEIDTANSKPTDGNVNTDSNSDSNSTQIKSDCGANLPPEDLGFNSELPVPTSATLSGEPLAEVAMDAVYPLAVAATQLLCDVLWLPHHRPHSASVAAFLSISGKPFENYLQDFLDALSSKEAFLGYIEMATAAIKDWAKEDTPVDQEPDDAPETSEADLKICLKQKIPVWVRWMWGRSRLDMTIDRLTKVCQDTQINQDLILSLVELLFSKLVDPIELETEEFK